MVKNTKLKPPINATQIREKKAKILTIPVFPT